MNSLCEGGADKGAAFYYARHLFASCTHKLYAPDHPADAPPVPVCTRSDLCRGCPYPAHGFLCWSTAGECLRTRMKKIHTVREGKRMMHAVLSNSRHPGYGQPTVPFPIPRGAYDDTVAALASLGIGDPVGRDCRVDELNSSFLILKRLEKVAVNVDGLDYLAKRLDSSDINEAAKFQAMTVKWGLFEMTDLINLTFWCQQATIITDFSDLEDIGRRHYMPLNGGSCSTEELERLDARKAALDLILNSESTCVTPCGVVYDNDMKLEHHYDGQHFPCYLCQPAMLVVGIFPKNAPEGSSETTWLTLPCSEQ